MLFTLMSVLVVTTMQLIIGTVIGFESPSLVSRFLIIVSLMSFIAVTTKNYDMQMIFF